MMHGQKNIKFENVYTMMHGQKNIKLNAIFHILYYEII